MANGVQVLRKALQDAAIRFASLLDVESAQLLDEVAEEFGVAKRRAKIRREKWKERQAEKKEETVGDGYKICRVEGCKNAPEWRPVILLEAEDGKDPIKAETALLDVCDDHARNLGPEVYTDNAAIWGAICRVFEENGLEAPDPDAVSAVEYIPIPKVNGAVNG